MNLFASLYQELDETTKTGAKVKALVAYFRQAPPEDAIWAVRFLTGRKPRQVVPARKLREWASEKAGIPLWMFEASYEAVGDLAETITLLLPKPDQSSPLPLHRWVKDHLLPLRGKPEEIQRQEVFSAWEQMGSTQRFVWNKLITGGFRVGVSEKLVVRALALVSGIEEAVIAHRLMGEWAPERETFERLVAPEISDALTSRPYPFFLAHPLIHEVAGLGDIGSWQVEWKWDGIRAQLIKREGRVFLWSRGEEQVIERFPELVEAGRALPDGTVLDGEILPWSDGRPLGFSELQKRIGRKNLSPRILEQAPVVFMAYDLLEFQGRDIRTETLARRMEGLTELLSSPPRPRLILSPRLSCSTWEEAALKRGQARERGVEGLMLKRLDSRYGVGRKRGEWWKWKVSPLTVDAVLIYAQGGHGRRSGLYTDYTFAVWDHDSLVPFAKAYSGLSDREIRQVDRFIKRNTLEKFGPVRSVKPELVFEIAFEGIQESSRHKSGVAVRFPRIQRWRTDKKVEDADTVEILRGLIENSRQG
jgi:DNA ligase-1